MYFHEQEFLLTLDKVTQLSALTILKSQWYCSRQKIIRKPLKFKNMFHMLLIQRNKLKCSEGWKDTNQQLHKRSSQDLLRIPRCQGWAEHWPRMSGWRLRHSMQKPDRPWDPQSKPQSLLPGLRSGGAPSHAESGECSSNTLCSSCISWLWRRKGHALLLLVQTMYMLTRLCVSAHETAARGT